MFAPTKKPDNGTIYCCGYRAARKWPEQSPECPYSQGSLDYEEWHRGYIDGTDDLIQEDGQ